MPSNVLPAFTLAAATLAATASAEASPPNIVYIIADDQAYGDFGFMGSRRVHTPHLDALAARAARFPNGYVPSSVCRPSLATLLTGLHPHQHQIHFNHGPPGNAGYNRMTSPRRYRQLRSREFALIRSVATLPGVLQRERGYRSLQTGKFWEGHWRNGGFTEGMTLFAPPPAGQTFGGVRTLADGQRVAHGNGDAGLIIGRQTMAPIERFIDDCELDDDPWLVWYAPYLPHQPHDSPQQYYELAGRRPGVAPHELPYFASIAQFDATVGRLVDYVRRKGLLERTLFVLVSDNGWRPGRRPQAGRPRQFAPDRRSKRSPFEDGLRTPVLIRWDGTIPPQTHDCLVSTVDLMPTLLSAAGLERHGLQLPGVDLLKLARGESRGDADRAVFGEIYPGDASQLGRPARDVAYRWVRQGRWKLVVPHSRSGAQPWGGYLEETALFDVVDDPRESSNLARLPEHQERVTKLGQLLDAWWDPDAAEPR